ncbi:MAG TPA: hypothetical protein VGN57_11610 [Pirellulaceae bacterium]|jgi:hypothetical protein|nr:hypothetical protein [Pirellulaceae bacterium]
MQLDPWDLLLFSLLAYVATLFAFQQLFARRKSTEQTASADDRMRNAA